MWFRSTALLLTTSNSNKSAKAHHAYIHMHSWSSNSISNIYLDCQPFQWTSPAPWEKSLLSSNAFIPLTFSPFSPLKGSQFYMLIKCQYPREKSVRVHSDPCWWTLPADTVPEVGAASEMEVPNTGKGDMRMHRREREHSNIWNHSTNMTHKHGRMKL